MKIALVRIATNMGRQLISMNKFPAFHWKAKTDESNKNTFPQQQ